MADARSVFLAVIKGDASQAVTEFNKMGDSVSRSTGKSTTAIGKFTALGKSAMSELGVNAQTMAAGAVAAFAKFAASGTQEFVKLAKAAGDLSRATGLSVEQSSQWIEVAGDFGVSSESLAGAIGRINKNLATDKFEKYGIAITDASGKALTSQEILLNVLGAMNNTPDAGKRAKMGADLMGRGWQSLAPILGKSRSEYEALLESVSDGQTITAEENKTAMELIAIQQDVADAYANYQLEVGKSGAPVIKLTDSVRRLNEVLDVMAQRSNVPGLSVFKTVVESIVNPMYKVSKAAEIFNGIVEEVFGEETSKSINNLSDDMSALGASYIVGGINVLSREMANLGEESRIVSDDVLSIRQNFMLLLDAIDEEQGLLDLKDGFDDIRDAAQEYFDAVRGGSDDVDEKQRAYERSLLDSRESLILYLDSLGDVPPTVVSDILAMIDEGKLSEAETALNNLARFREARIGVTTSIGGRTMDGGVSDFIFGRYALPSDLEAMAKGGPVSGGSPYLVGEKGPELFVPGSSGSIVPNSAMGGGNTINVYVTNPVQNGEQLANELQSYARRVGVSLFA
jgi:hypothetical protein